VAPYQGREENQRGDFNYVQFGFRRFGQKGERQKYQQCGASRDDNHFSGIAALTAFHFTSGRLQ
jgi:hypothetical protein